MSDEPERRIPLVEERARIEKRVVERKRVSIRTATTESQQVLSDTLRREQLDIRRVAVNQEVDAIPNVREEGDVVIIPIVEERAVLVKRLVLVAELHVQRKLLQAPIQVPVTLRSTEVFVEPRNLPNGEDT
ncbi:YsnF/AvaK domain-containing protein [Peristeroidobacter agariperforans]|uniref:YsnF/AvaK domain-containing protein n=1 Tax=Peristeroidobacter agariperforans TaxID=268404 RepID=UPI0013001CA8|nr:YsnF/AvaK domain-containing protein [Peristeroidobacter agariperforans]